MGIYLQYFELPIDGKKFVLDTIINIISIYTLIQLIIDLKNRKMQFTIDTFHIFFIIITVN